MNDIKVVTTNIWQQDGEIFWPGNTTNNTKKLTPAIYRYGTSPMGWYLERTAPRYTFPYKIYGTHDEIINRIKRAWNGLPANIGVLLNGLKGTGKTITAQQIVNWAIDEGFAVINIQQPVPLATIMEKIEQSILVLFDEFEKTHDEAQNPGAQQALLSAVDGLSRNDHRRLFLFTTNEKRVNNNFVDRPSRIRYCWEFDRLGNDLIEMLLDDLLDKKLAHLRPEIISYLNTREILTMDVAKTVIIECNVFQEGPEAFKKFLNLTEKEPGSFKVEIVDDMGAATEVSSYFKSSSHGALLSSLMSKSGRASFIDNYCARDRTLTVMSNAGHRIEILGPTDKNDNEWICHVQMPAYKTWIGLQLRGESCEFMWLDNKPENWRTPEWARKLEAKAELTAEEREECDDWINSQSVFGTDKRRKVKVRFTIENNQYIYDPKKLMYMD